MLLTIRSDHARGEAEQRQRHITFLFAAGSVAHAELGIELGRDSGGLSDILLATDQYPFTGLKILVVVFGHAIFDGAVNTHLDLHRYGGAGIKQGDGTADARTDGGRDSLLDGTGTNL